MRETCAACNRPLPLPKTEKSPATKKKAYWVPVDVAEDHEALIDAAAKYLGVFDEPFYQQKVMEIGVVLILQDDKLRDFGKARA